MSVLVSVRGLAQAELLCPGGLALPQAQARRGNLGGDRHATFGPFYFTGRLVVLGSYPSVPFSGPGNLYLICDTESFLSFLNFT